MVAVAALDQFLRLLCATQSEAKSQAQLQAIEEAKRERERILAEKARLLREAEDAKQHELAHRRELEHIQREIEQSELARKVTFAFLVH